jgi:hypothetical protein
MTPAAPRPHPARPAAPDPPWWNVANLLTLLRVAARPGHRLLLVIDDETARWWAFGIFVFAALDRLDRRLGGAPPDGRCHPLGPARRPARGQAAHRRQPRVLAWLGELPWLAVASSPSARWGSPSSGRARPPRHRHAGEPVRQGQDAVPDPGGHPVPAPGLPDGPARHAALWVAVAHHRRSAAWSTPFGGKALPVRAEVVAVGSELLLGDARGHELRLDLRPARRDRRRRRTGTRPSGTTERIAAVLEEGARRADAVMVTGGLGPTQDDLTRTRSAEVAGVALERGRSSSSTCTATSPARAARCPSATSSRPTCRRAPGCSRPSGPLPASRGARGRAVVYCVPGVPREMEEMFAARSCPICSSARTSATVSRWCGPAGWPRRRSPTPARRSSPGSRRAGTRRSRSSPRRGRRGCG